MDITAATRETQNKAETVKLNQDHIDSLRMYGRVDSDTLDQMQAELDQFKAE